MTTTAGSVVVHTKGAVTVTIDEDPIQAVLHALDDPNIAFILLVVGVLCVLVEFFHPTMLVGLARGALALALSFYGSGSLPLNLLGVVLVVLGIVMIVLEPNVPSHGLLTVGRARDRSSSARWRSTARPVHTCRPSSVAWPIIAHHDGLAAGYGLLLRPDPPPDAATRRCPWARDGCGNRGRWAGRRGRA